MDWDWIKNVSELNEKGTPFALVTVAGITGSTPRDIGAKMIVLEDGTFQGTIGGGNLERKVIDDALTCLAKKESKTIDYPLGASVGQCCGGKMMILIEIVGTGPELYIFGAGHVGQALSKTMVGTPFKIHLIDERKEWIEHGSLPDAIVRHPIEWETFVDQARWDPNQTYAVVMTYQHDLDQAIIESLIQRPAKFIGLIGSDAKWRRFQDRLLQKRASQDSLSRVQCPIGIPTGGKAPQEVAISIASALLQMHYGA